MKKLVSVVTTLAMVLAFAVLANAEDKATPKECVQKVQEAVKLIQDKGDAAFDTLRDKNGPFVWKDSYVFVMDFDGVMKVHPMNPKLEGRNLNMIKDSSGKMFNAEMVAVAKGPGQGWVDYLWLKPGASQPSPKVSYIVGIPDKNLLVGAGVWDMTKAEAEKEAK
ncbi:MAG: cache domain-containing protein [Deltaproteobacteria bacterium]|nr:cache domain-containing protein [Deltaproteobacteria bacterium]